MNEKENKKEERPVATDAPPQTQNNPCDLNLPAKRIKLTPTVPQSDIDAVLKRLAGMRKRLRSDILFIGGRMAKMRSEIPYGRWTRFVEETFPLSVKSANIWIRAWEGKDTEVALNDWDGYMRALYGNSSKR